MVLASAGLASANRGLPCDEAARLSRQGGQLPTPSSVIPAEQTGLLKSPYVDTGLVGASALQRLQNGVSLVCYMPLARLLRESEELDLRA